MSFLSMEPMVARLPCPQKTQRSSVATRPNNTSVPALARKGPPHNRHAWHEACI
jgi:hypothetical protein